MQITITLDTNDLNERDFGLLRGLLGEANDAAPAPAAKAAAAPAKKAAASKPAPTPEPEPEDEDEPAGGATLEEAVALATKLVSNGEAAKVKAALGTVGAKKVSEIPEDKVDEFIAELS